MESRFDVLSSFLLFLTIFTGITDGERTKDKMYEKIQGTAACFRRLNGTHQFGCASGRGGNVGVVQLVNSMLDVEWLLKSSKAGPYMAVLPPAMFNREVMTLLRDSGSVNGAMLANHIASEGPDAFSPDDACPNRYSGASACDASNAWNPAGNAMLLEDWGFPVFHLDDLAVLEDITQCYTKHNAENKEEQESRSLCSIEMNAFMFAAVDAKTCIRRSNIVSNINPIRYCDPLGDHNIWSTLHPRPLDSENSSVVIVATRLDATSMFDGLVPGAITPTTGVVTLLATAHMLKRMLPQPTDTNVLFALLHGESYDYIGSSRLLYDMQRDQFPGPRNPEDPAPIRPQDVKLFVELSQLAVTGNELFLHRPAGSDEQVTDFVSQLQMDGGKQGLKFTDVNNGRVPPASLQTFLKEIPDFPGLVLADHKAEFTNKFYHSVYDDGHHLGYSYANGSTVPPGSIQARLAGVTAALANALYHAVTQRDYTGAVTPNVTLVDELLHCYLDTTNCSVFRAVTSPQQLLPDAPAQHYVGVSVSANLLTALTGQALAALTGDTVNKTEQDCHGAGWLFQYIWMSGRSTGVGNDTGECVKTTMNYSPAVSPAFIIDDYDWSSGNYSTWAESIWRDFSVRMFLKPSRSQETTTFCAGAIVLVLSFLVVYFVNDRSDILFGRHALGAAC